MGYEQCWQHQMCRQHPVTLAASLDSANTLCLLSRVAVGLQALSRSQQLFTAVSATAVTSLGLTDHNTQRQPCTCMVCTQALVAELAGHL